MLCVHLPKPNKCMTRGTLLLRKDFSAQIIPLFSPKTLNPFPLSFWEMLPHTSTLERSTSQSKILPSHVPDLNPIAWTASRMTAAAGHCPGTAMSSTLGIPSSPNPPETSSSSPSCWGHSSSRAHPYPSQGHLPLQICLATGPFALSQQSVSICWTATYCPGSFMQDGENNPSTSPFQILISLSAKIPHENVAFTVAVYFYLAHL